MQISKIGFWPVFSIVVGSQIGSGVFMLPASLAPYGIYSLLGWIISAAGALALAMVFAKLCASYPQTGGPHVYVGKAFGPTAAFFTGWTYWVISWVSTTAVIIASIGYLTPLIGQHSLFIYLMLEIALLLIITLVNLKGIEAAGHAEFILTILKILPLFIIPLCAFPLFEKSNFIVSSALADTSLNTLLGKTTLLTLWAFIGLESATAPAGSVEKPERTIPLAITLGTLCVAFLYLLNSVGIMGLIPGPTLHQSEAPYVDVVKVIFGGNWYVLISIIASIVCIGTLNAWILTSGQIALGVAEEGLFPAPFAKKNLAGAPAFGLICSSLGIIPLLILTASDRLSHQITLIIDFSVTAFLFIYLFCCITFFRLYARNPEFRKRRYLIAAIIATLFCVWILYETPPKVLLMASLFSLSGLPLYWFWYRRQSKVCMPVEDRHQVPFAVEDRP